VFFLSKSATNDYLVARILLLRLRTSPLMFVSVRTDTMVLMETTTWQRWCHSSRSAVDRRLALGLGRLWSWYQSIFVKIRGRWHRCSATFRREHQVEYVNRDRLQTTCWRSCSALSATLRYLSIALRCWTITRWRHHRPITEQ